MTERSVYAIVLDNLDASVWLSEALLSQLTNLPSDMLRETLRTLERLNGASQNHIDGVNYWRRNTHGK